MSKIKHPPVMDQITVVLVRPQGDGNVGQVARAMKNFGANRLKLVQPCEVDTEFCRQMASKSYEIVERAERHDTLQGALAGSQYVVGATRRIGKNRPRTLASRELPDWLLPKLTGGQQAAIVFGNEVSGLDNQELDLCHDLVEIETDPAHHSLNLAQAVLLLLYELFSQALEERPESIKHQPAKHSIMERLFAHMRRMYLEVGFLNPENPEAVMRALRRLYGRAAPNDREVRILRGILNDTEWYLNHVAEKGERDGYSEVARNSES